MVGILGIAFFCSFCGNAETMKEEIKGLEYQIDTLKNDLKDFKRVYKSVRDIKYTYQQIDGLKGKKSVFCPYGRNFRHCLLPTYPA